MRVRTACRGGMAVRLRGRGRRLLPPAIGVVRPASPSKDGAYGAAFRILLSPGPRRNRRYDLLRAALRRAWNRQGERRAGRDGERDRAALDAGRTGTGLSGDTCRYVPLSSIPAARFPSEREGRQRTSTEISRRPGS